MKTRILHREDAKRRKERKKKEERRKKKSLFYCDKQHSLSFFCLSLRPSRLRGAKFEPFIVSFTVLQKYPIFFMIKPAETR
jgi:hypothetical protein